MKNETKDNSRSTVESEEPGTPKSVESEAPPTTDVAPPPTLVTRATLHSQPPLTQNKLLLIAGGGIAVALLLFLFASAPRGPANKGDGSATRHQGEASQTDEPGQKSLFPVMESTRPPAKTPDGGLVGEQDVAHTATKRPPQISAFAASTPPQNGTLGSIPPFDSWQAPAYQTTNASGPAFNESKVGREPRSLIFVQKIAESSALKSQDHLVLDSEPSIGLPIGTRLRARLESAASTAVKTPIIAVVEYNYEKNGEIVVPAGTKAFGRIEQADRTGYMSIRFDALLMPDGSQSEIDAVATDLKLGPLRGKVEGKHTGKNILLRSLSGIGEAGALLAGHTSSLNQPFSQEDLIRQQISTNIGQSADQTLLGLAVSEHTVVSIFADTPIYLILDRSAKQTPGPEPASHVAPATSTNSAESLRQLLQLQHELNQSVDVTSHSLDVPSH